MESTLVIINPSISEPLAADWFNTLLPGGQTAKDLLVEKSNHPMFSSIYFLSDHSIQWEIPQNWNAILIGELTNAEVFASLQFQENNRSPVVFLWADMPLVSIENIQICLDLMKKYRSEFVNADGYPLGLFPEILDSGVLPIFRSLSERHTLSFSRKGVFETAAKDINAFDIETKVSPIDLRQSRVTLALSEKRRSLLVKRLMESAGSDVNKILDWIKSGRGLRTLPKSFVLQIQSSGKFLGDYYPDFVLNSTEKEMPLENIQKIIKNISQWAGDGVLSLALGEPSLHSKIEEIILAVLEQSKLNLVIETSGHGWEKSLIEKIANAAQERITWIIEVDTLDPQLYQKIHSSALEDVIDFLDQLIVHFPGKIYAQSTRTDETDPGLETFYSVMKEKGIEPIIQKFNHFSSRIKSRKIVDLSPVKRFPCWHLKRDMVFWVDGTVSPCRDDWEKDLILGSFPQVDLVDLWEGGVSLYSEHLKGIYPSICENCDEYYTFHF